MKKRRPNIVLIVLDSVRKDHVSCYGYGRPTTPNIDHLAREGVLFRQAYATSCWTIPAHASLFTGLYPSQHRADMDTRRLDASHETLAAMLRRAGYRSACITSNGFLTDHTNLNHGFERTLDVDRLLGGASGLLPRVIRGLHRRWRDRTAHDRGGRRATDLAARWLKEQDGERPFFLFLNYMECHLPYRLRGADRYRFVDGVDRDRVDAVPQDPFRVMAGQLDLSEQDVQYLRALYDASLCYIDQQVGRLTARLRRLGLEDDTLVIVTSDHGESFGEHGLFDHQYGLYEHLISVPLLLRLPGRNQRGTVRDGLAQHVDVLPTIAELTGVEPDGRTTAAGRSLFGTTPREVAVAEYLVPNLRAMRRRFPGVDVSRFDVPLRSIQDHRYKLIRARAGDDELYDLVTDPGEHANVVSEHPDAAARLGSRLDALVGGWPARDTAGEEDDEGLAEVRDRLEALGYL